MKSIDENFATIENMDKSVLDKAEMTIEQMGFLCGIINRFNPYKILEVGVAAGSTSAVIMHCLETLAQHTEFFSVDLCEKLYYKNELDTGYVAIDYARKNPLQYVDYKLLLGKYLPQQLEVIGKKIDLVILDTVHHLPGELLDFLAVLPYLNDNAIVVLHDISLEHTNPRNDRYAYATQILFQTVKADKLMNNDKEYPNIAAFRINKFTKEDIYDVFSALTLSWHYYPIESELAIYKDFYHKYYDKELCGLFDQAISLNYQSMHRMDFYTSSYIDSLVSSILTRFDHILLYGAGKRGGAIFRCLKDKAAFISKVEFVVSSEQEAEKKECLCFDRILYAIKDTLIVLTADSDDLRIKLTQSGWIWMDIPDAVWSNMEVVYGD